MPSLIALHDPEIDQRMIRTEDLFFSMIYDRGNRCLRVIDFRTGNFPVKETVIRQLAEEFGAHKIFTLIERDDINGWQRMGFTREGSIPGYYKRSDAYFMSCLPNQDVEILPETTEDPPKRRKLLAEMKKAAKGMKHKKDVTGRLREIDFDDALKFAENEMKRLSNVKSSKKRKDSAVIVQLARKLIPGPVFQNFSRDGQRIFLLIQQKRSRTGSLMVLEYQDCFGNVKISFLRPPVNEIEASLTLNALNMVLDEFTRAGAVAAFAFPPVEWTSINAIFINSGFRKAGWLTHHRRSPDDYHDCVLWARRLT